MKTAVIVSLVVFNVLLLFAIALLLLRRWGRSVLQQLREATALRGEDSLRGEPLASFRGLLSDGIPLRGNAVVLLTTRALYVVRLWPHREFTVPLERMTRIEVSRAFMGKHDASGFLIIHFNAGPPAGGAQADPPDAGEDAIGLTIRRLLEWVAEVVQTARPYLKEIQGRKNPGAGTGEGATGGPPA